MDIQAAVDTLRRWAPAARPRIAVLLGSGWGALAQRVELARSLSYSSIPGFPPAGVAGHAGRLTVGHIGAHPVAILSGRQHAYETGEPQGMKLPLRALRAWGCALLVQTNAAGSLHAAMPPGSLMLLADHINFPQRSPLTGECGHERFVPMADAYDADLRAQARALAAGAGVNLHEGVYALMTGPQFETPAEIRMLRILGADAVGMSTVAETIVARHAGLRVLALSLITNLAAGLSDEVLSHAHTLAQADAHAQRACDVLQAIVAGLVLPAPRYPDDDADHAEPGPVH